MFKKPQSQIVVTSCVFNCLKEKCPKWVVLTNIIEAKGGESKEIHEGRCAEAWTPMLLVEIKEMVKKQCQN